jgi:hypothetical protein
MPLFQVESILQPFMYVLARARAEHTHARSKSKSVMSGPREPLYVLLAILCLSSPITSYIVRVAHIGVDVEWWMVLNSYLFSSAMTLMWVYPFVWPGCGSFRNRLRMATQHWHWVLGSVVVAVFQSIHNFAVPVLHANVGTPINWPFEAYSLSDDRWDDYNEGNGIAHDMIWYINCNDVFWATSSLVAMAYARYQLGSWTAFSPLVTVVALFRDATVWRETVE